MPSRVRSLSGRDADDFVAAVRFQPLAREGVVDLDVGLVNLDVGRHPVLRLGDVIDGLDVTLEGLARQGIDADGHRQARPDVVDERLVDAEGDEHVRQVGDAHHLLAVLDRLALGDDRLGGAGAGARLLGH